MLSFKEDRPQDISGIHNLAACLLNWYEVEKRDLPWRKTGDPYAIWVSEVMLQQTQVKTVIPYYERFLRRFPNVEELGRASLEEVLTVWQGLGYYSRARRMWEGARYLLEQRAGRMPIDYETLLQVPGIGDYTAGAIASIAYGQKVPAVDGNVKRVVSRLLAWTEPVETVHSLRCFKEKLEVWQPVFQAGDFNQALMELGALICTPAKPICECCPVNQECEGFRQGNVLQYPVKKPKTPRQELTRLTFVLRRGDQVYLQKRPSDGLLADLWEFPGLEFKKGDCLENNLPVILPDELFNVYQKTVSDRAYDNQVKDQFSHHYRLHGPVWYTFSHRRWKIVWVIIDLSNKTEPGLDKKSIVRETGDKYSVDSTEKCKSENQQIWISLGDLSEIPLPVAFAGVVEQVKAEYPK